MTAPRIAPAPADQVRPLLAPLLAGPGTPDGAAAEFVRTNPVLNVLATIGNHPALLAGLTPLLAELATGPLPARDRELVILRVAWPLRSDYEWAHHVAIGTGAGLTEPEIARIPAGPTAAGWPDFDAALLRAVDELRGPDAALSDPTWQRLASRYDDRQLLELLALVGTYTLVGYVLNSCRVRVDDWLPSPAALPSQQPKPAG